MKKAIYGLLCVPALWLIGTVVYGQIAVVGGPGAMSAVTGDFVIVDWRLAGEVEFLRSPRLGGRVWLLVGEALNGVGWGLGPSLRWGQFSFVLGIQQAVEAFALIGGAAIEFALGRTGPARLHFINDLQFALSLSDQLPSYLQYHVAIAVGF